MAVAPTSAGTSLLQGREKINLVYLFTKMGFSILVSDVDTVWMRNPLPYMAQYPEADILTSSDHLVTHSRSTQKTITSTLSLPAIQIQAF